VDNDIEGRYESFLDPTEKLQAIRLVAEAAHKAGNKAFVYIAGTECISLNADGPHTLAREHPDWLQRKITGQAGDLWSEVGVLDPAGRRGRVGEPYAEPCGRFTCNASGRSLRPASTGSMSTFLTG